MTDPNTTTPATLRADALELLREIAARKRYDPNAKVPWANNSGSITINLKSELLARVDALLDAAPAAPVAEYDGNHVQNHCTECNEHEAECTCTAAVAADGASTQRCNLGVGCDEAGVCYASAHGDASQCGRAAVSPATAEPTDYAAIEREHFGDPDKRTGIYAQATADRRPAQLDTSVLARLSAQIMGVPINPTLSKFARAVEANVRASQAAAPADAREPQWSRDIIADLQVLFDTDGITENDSGDALIRLSDAIAAVENARPVAPADAGEAVASIENPLTPYGMLVRALRIVAGTTLMDMATAMRVSPAFLSSLEFGRRPVTYDNAVFASGFFSDKGIVDTLPALAHAAKESQGAQGGKGGEA
ncbi:helix-turn-helix domain-containing protein [Burkholderia glumae]|uniref:helix-turn-helix domain-containing protein n=1 Tax=Burkholderia glumae TaxID=337 RepID=UPI0021504F63|nr:helix-turn-helix transcriptional regulator [Burkholderia glumae]